MLIAGDISGTKTDLAIYCGVSQITLQKFGSFLRAQKSVLRSRGRLRSTMILFISCIVKLFQRHHTRTAIPGFLQPLE